MFGPIKETYEGAEEKIQGHLRGDNTEGEVDLRASEGISEQALKNKAKDIIPMGRMLNRFDPVPAVMHFISDESAMTTGSLIRITGGEYI